jgi:hypothetical protein
MSYLFIGDCTGGGNRRNLLRHHSLQIGITQDG